eukprot:ANDGO_04514.mRNA.1 26S proteasome non-ATPase regulatory subunit 9
MNSNSSGITAADIKLLVSQKDALEAEIHALQSESAAIGSLVDSDGFPRSDIDIPAHRTRRNKLAMLKTDHSELMKRIEDALFALHQNYKQQDEQQRQQHGDSREAAQMAAAADEKCGADSSLSTLPIAKVGAVQPHSAASDAGFLEGDLILQVDGDLHSGSIQYGLAQIGQHIRRRELHAVRFLVRRGTNVLHLAVVIPQGPLGMRLLDP